MSVVNIDRLMGVQIKKMDFPVCMGLDDYVGVTNYTASNRLFLENRSGECAEEATHYIYNNGGGAFLQSRSQCNNE